MPSPPAAGRAGEASSSSRRSPSQRWPVGCRCSPPGAGRAVGRAGAPPRARPPTSCSRRAVPAMWHSRAFRWRTARRPTVPASPRALRGVALSVSFAQGRGMPCARSPSAEKLYSPGPLPLPQPPPCRSARDVRKPPPPRGERIPLAQRGPGRYRVHHRGAVPSLRARAGLPADRHRRRLPVGRPGRSLDPVDRPPGLGRLESAGRGGHGCRPGASEPRVSVPGRVHAVLGRKRGRAALG